MMSKVEEKKEEISRKKYHRNIRWMLVLYDLVVYVAVAAILLIFYCGSERLTGSGVLQQICLAGVWIFLVRIAGNIYGQVWRYGGIQCYIRLLFTDAVAFIGYLGTELLLPIQKISFARMVSLVSLNLLGALTLRMVYRYAYKCGDQRSVKGRILSALLHMFGGIESEPDKEVQKIKVAIIGAGRVGVSLAEELLNNPEASYLPRCFIETNPEKVGREIQGLPIWSEDEATFSRLGEYEVQEIIFAIPSMDAKKKKKLYEYYKYAGRGNKFIDVIRLTTETLSGIPSIVYGLFGMLFFVNALHWGFSILAGAFTLSIMILPLIMRTTEEALKSVPDSYREGSFGLGAGKLRTVFKIVLPSAVPGILAGVILAIGRIVGETAALIYTAGTVAQIPKNAFGSGRTLAVHMYMLSSEGLYMNQAYATAVILLILVVVINTLSGMIAKRLTKK